jgi:hypothetical protein
MTWQSELEAMIEETQALASAVQAKIPKQIASATLAEQPPAESSQPKQVEPTFWAAAGSERAEIKRRVASFKVVQDRMQREREDYFMKTLANARQGPWGASPPRET